MQFYTALYHAFMPSLYAVLYTRVYTRLMTAGSSQGIIKLKKWLYTRPTFRLSEPATCTDIFKITTIPPGFLINLQTICILSNMFSLFR